MGTTKAKFSLERLAIAAAVMVTPAVGADLGTAFTLQALLKEDGSL